MDVETEPFGIVGFETLEELAQSESWIEEWLY